MATRDRLELTERVSNDDDEKKNRYIAKLRDHVVAKIVNENRTMLSSLADDRDQLTRLVEERIAKMFTDFHTPDHPPYAFMIRRAITELIDEGRSDKGAISEFIRKEYQDLPVAHESVLTYQLNKLCEKGEILLSAVGCYLLPAGDYVQQKIVMRKNGEERVEKKLDVCGEYVLKGGDLKGNGAVDGSREREVCLRQMNSRKRKGGEGLQTRTRWSRRLHYNKIQVDEANKSGSEIVKDISITQTREENDACRNQKCHIDIVPIAGHKTRDQQFDIIEDPFEPPGFSSKSDHLITQKQLVGTDLQAFEIGAEVEQNNEMKSDTLQCFDGGNISGCREHDVFKPSCDESLQPGTGHNATPAPALDNDSMRSNYMATDLHNIMSAEIANDCVLVLDQTTGVGLSPLREEEAAGSLKCQGIWPCTDNVPGQLVLNATIDMALEDQQTLSTEVVTVPANPTLDTYPTALLNSQPDDGQHPKKQDAPMCQARVRPWKTSNGFSITIENSKKKYGQGRPRKEKADELLEPKTDVEAESSSKKTADYWDKEVAGTKYLQQNSNSVNHCILGLKAASQYIKGTSTAKRVRRPSKIDEDEISETMDFPKANSNSVNHCILGLKAASQYKKGTNMAKRIRRPSKIDEDEISETMDFPKAKEGRGKEVKRICYTDTSITDLIYSQDHLLQPMTRFRGRPRKL